MTKWTAWMLALAGCASTSASPAAAPSVTPPVATEEGAASTSTAAPGPCSSVRVDPSGTTQTVHTYVQGRRVRSQSEGPHGSRQTLLSYDADGRRTKEVLIEDGRVHASVFHYRGGLLISTEIDDDGAGHVVERRLRDYDDRGKLRTRTIERNGPAGFVPVRTHALHYDDAGRFSYELIRHTPLEGPHSVQSVTVEVDPFGRVSARLVDDGMTGSFENTERFDYTAEGKLALATSLEGDALVKTTRHSYDEQGRLVRTKTSDAEGRVSAETVYDFSCWAEAPPR